MNEGANMTFGKLGIKKLKERFLYVDVRESADGSLAEKKKKRKIGGIRSVPDTPAQPPRDARDQRPQKMKGPVSAKRSPEVWRI